MNLAHPINFAALMAPVAKRLLGEPNARLSRPPQDLRYGTHGSMSVNEEAGQFFDHEANIGGGVLDLIKHKRGIDHGAAIHWLRQEGLLPGAPSRPIMAPRTAPNGGAKLKVEAAPAARAEIVVAKFPYRNAFGVVVLVVERIEFQNPDSTFVLAKDGKREKSFRQKRPDPEHPGGWISNANGVPPLPYRLPELIEAIACEHPVIIVEGEGKADLLSAWNVVATCCAGGAKKWRGEHSEFLRGADVVIVPDNDEPGRHHAEQVAASLTGVAKRIRLLDLAKCWPECPAKGDIADWIKNGGGTADQLNALVADLADWQPPAPEGWPAPKPLPAGMIPVDPFDYEFLPLALREWVKDTSNRLQCPPDYVAVAAITALGTLIGRRLGIKPQSKTDWIEVPNLWGMFIGPPGLMKSPAMEEALRPLHRIEAEARKENGEAQERHEREFHAFKLKKDAKNALAKKALDKDPAAKVDLEFGDEPQEPAPIRYITNDSTYEGLGELLIGNPMGILVERDEIVSLLKYLEDEEHVVARGFYLTGWSGKSSYSFDRIGRGHRSVDAVCIGIIGNTQPARIAEFIRRTNADGTGGDGLMQRFGLMVWPDTPTTWNNVDEYPDVEAKEAAWKVFKDASAIDLNEALKMGAHKGEFDSVPCLRLDPKALEEFSAWRARLEALIRSGEIAPALEGHLAKYRTLVPALALINHVADERDKGAVSQASILRSLAFAKYLESHARRVYGAGIVADVAAAKAILRHIKSGDLLDGFTAREIQRKNWTHLTEAHHVAAGLDLLVELHYLGVKDMPPGQKGGRPTASYLINPAVPQPKKGAAA